MLDATELALAIVEHVDDLETAFATYESAMVPRAAAAAEGSARGLELCFAADAPRGMVEFFSQARAPEPAVI